MNQLKQASLKKSSWLDKIFKLSERKTTTKIEMIGGVTTFLAMVYSLFVVPNLLSQAGFPAPSVFLGTCLVAGLGSILMGLWANLPMAIGCALSLTAFTAFTLVLGLNLPIPVALGLVFWLGIIFSVISLSGGRKWILRNIPLSIAHGTGIGIGLFLFLIATSNESVGLILKNPIPGSLPVQFGDFQSFPVLMSLIGLAAIIGLEKRKIKGSILIVVIIISVIGAIFDPNIVYQGFFKMPSFDKEGLSLFWDMDLKGALQWSLLPVLIALVMTALFDATGTIRAVAEQGELINHKNQIINGDKALSADSVSSILAGIVGVSPAAVYIESAAGTAAGAKTGLSAVIVGILFLLFIFLSPLAALVPAYATAPALMYVGLLMLGNVRKLEFTDFIGATAGLVCAVFIVFTANIVTGIMIGFATLALGRLIAGEWRKLNVGTVLITIVLVGFYLSGLAL